MTEVVTAVTQESGEIVATRPSPGPTGDGAVYLTRTLPDGSTASIPLRDPNVQAVLRSAVRVGSWKNRETGISDGRAGNIMRELNTTIDTLLREEPHG